MCTTRTSAAFAAGCDKEFRVSYSGWKEHEAGNLRAGSRGREGRGGRPSEPFFCLLHCLTTGAQERSRSKTRREAAPGSAPRAAGHSSRHLVRWHRHLVPRPRRRPLFHPSTAVSGPDTELPPRRNAMSCAPSRSSAAIVIYRPFRRASTAARGAASVPGGGRAGVPRSSIASR